MGNNLSIQSIGCSNLKIRAHHLFCMRGFQGYGYSREFECNMEEVIQYLDLHPQSQLKVVASADVICRCCPYLEDEGCKKSSPSNVQNMDLEALKKLDVQEGTVKTVQELFKMVEDLKLDDLHDICGDCSWIDKCLFFQSKI